MVLLSPKKEERLVVQEFTCRVCYDDTLDRSEVIVPCLCSGSGKYICKECLQDWRANGETTRSFTHCPTCNFEYHLENDGQDHFLEGTICMIPATSFGRKSYFRYLVFSDFFLGFFLINAYLLQLGILIRWFDSHERLVHVMPWDEIVPHDDNEHLLKAFKHHKATYYAAALIISLCMFITIVSWQYFCTCRTLMHEMAASINFNKRNLNHTKLIGILIVFVLLKIVLGCFIALISLVFWMQKAVTRHVHILEKKEIANEFRVVDLELAGRLKYKRELGSEESVSASEPPKSHHLASETLLHRLFKSKLI